MVSKQFFMIPVCRVEVESDDEAAGRIYTALANAWIEIRGMEITMG